MLDEFLTMFRADIIAATCDKAHARLHPTISGETLRTGVPLFLTHLSAALKRERAAEPFTSSAIGDAATRHGADLLALGFTVSQVVHVYGDICQAVTELALAQNAPITVDEFRILNRSLDTAIADAVTEHSRRTAAATAADNTERLGQLAHELRNNVHTALLAFAALKGGTVALHGTTRAVLARSLTSLQALVDSTIAEVRLAAHTEPREMIAARALLADVGVTASLLAEHHKTNFSVEPLQDDAVVQGDRQLLTSALMNLLQNAVKFTPPGDAVVLRSHVDGDGLVIEIEDECGGFPGATDTFTAFAERRATDRSGLGLGLSIARQAIASHGGDIFIRNKAGKGCVFAVHLPLTVAGLRLAAAAAAANRTVMDEV